jgi:integrase
MIDLALQKMEAAVSVLSATMVATGERMTPERVRLALKVSGAGSLHSGRVVEVYDQYISEAAERFQPRTIQSHTTTRRHLVAFETAYKVTLELDRLDTVHLDKYAAYLRNVVGLLDNSLWKEAKNLRAFLRHAEGLGLAVHPAYRSFQFPMYEPRPVYLTRLELEQLAGLDLEGEPRLRAVRDMFLLQCFTGLRYSDLAQLRPENIHGDTLRLTARKTGDTLTIPLLATARAILARYPDRLPVVSNGRMNIHLKEIGKRAGLLTPWQTVERKGTTRLERIAPKWELIGTHTGRRTFVTLALEQGMRPEIVMRITGHKNSKTLQRYIVATPEVAARELERAWGE